MKSKIMIVIISVIAVISCSTQKNISKCKDFESYLKKVEKSKKYSVKGTFCIENSDLRADQPSKIKITIYDRVTGNLVDEGMVFFNDEKKKAIDSGIVFTELPFGVYDIGITTMDHLPFSIKGMA